MFISIRVLSHFCISQFLSGDAYSPHSQETITMSHQFISTAEPAGRPKRMERPVWHGAVLDQHPESPFRLTKTQNNRPVVLPPKTTEPAFQAALEDLRGQIGAKWVKVNDIDLVDGDYMYLWDNKNDISLLILPSCCPNVV